MSLIGVRHQRDAWSRTDLIRRLRGCLEIAYRTVSVLGQSGYNGSDNTQVSSDKIIAETALLLVASAPAVRGDSTAERLHKEIVLLLIPLARCERVRAGICLVPALAMDYAFAHICLTHLGYRDVELDQLLWQSISAKSAFSMERLPHRQLEHEWLQQLSRCSPVTLSQHRSELAKRSILSRPLDVLSARRGDIYAFTHALMFLSALGMSKVRLPRARPAVARDAEGALAWCLDEGDYDLGAEVLLTWPMLKMRWSPSAVFAFTVVMRVEDEAGFLPGPMINFDRFQTLESEQKSQYALVAAYHTVYVMGLLCAISLQPGSTPPAQVPAIQSLWRGAAAPILEILDRSLDKPHWRTDIGKLNRRQQDAIAPLLVSFALRRAFAKRDLSSLSAILGTVERYGLISNNATAVQTLELLARASAFGAMFRADDLFGRERSQRESSSRTS